MAIRRKSFVAFRVAERRGPGVRAQAVAERWLLRRVRMCGFAAPSNETIDALVRMGGAEDRYAGACALDALIRRGCLEQLDGILFLSREGEKEARGAAERWQELGDPPVPIPDRHLPTVVWSEADFETLTPPHEEVCCAQPTETGDDMSIYALANERFSLDDPDAGRKFVENLDRRKVRLAFSEACAQFACETPEDKEKLRSFLLGMEMDGLIVEVLSNLYCRPDMTQGSRDPDRLEKAVGTLRELRKRARRP